MFNKKGTLVEKWGRKAIGAKAYQILKIRYASQLPKFGTFRFRKVFFYFNNSGGAEFMNVLNISRLSILSGAGKAAAEWLPRLLQKCPSTYAHSVRVGIMAEKLATLLHLNAEQTRQLVTGCLLHDFGKILVPNDILNKTSQLTAEEWNIMKCHPKIGAEILEDPFKFDQEVIEIIQYHHERWDGKGYPEGLSGIDIPYFARICSVLDAYDCMINDRSYRGKMTIAEAERELLLHSESQFDEEIVRLLLQNAHQMRDLYEAGQSTS